MTIGELYDKFKAIEKLENTRDAILGSVIIRSSFSKEDLEYIAYHKNILAPKKGDQLRNVYDQIQKLNEQIERIRMQSIRIDSTDIDDDDF